MEEPMATVTLAQMRSGQTGIIEQIRGGRGIHNRLLSMGIRPGEPVTKVSSQWMRGPVLLRHGNTQLAIGYGMARNILMTAIGEGDDM
jgi:ferrous iron transport protein A